MSAGVEFFGAGEASESYDPAAFERFREQMKKNARFVAAQQKSEARQKQKEEALLKILMRFFQSRQNQNVIVLAARMLEQNIPATFVLHLIVLGNDELKAQTREALLISAPEAVAPEDATDDGKPDSRTDNSRPSEPEGGRWLIPSFHDATLPLRVKAEIDEWSKALIEAARTNPYRLLDTALEKSGVVKKVVIDCAATVMENFLREHHLAEVSYDAVFSFSELLVQGILQNLKNEMEAQKSLDGESY